MGAPHDYAVTSAVGAAAGRLIERLPDPAPVIVKQAPVQHHFELPRLQRRTPCTPSKKSSNDDFSADICDCLSAVAGADADPTTAPF